jgi:hypothetical protein
MNHSQRILRQALSGKHGVPILLNGSTASIRFIRIFGILLRVYYDIKVKSTQTMCWFNK